MTGLRLTGFRFCRVSKEDYREKTIVANDRSLDLSYLAIVEEHIRRMFGERDDSISDALMEDRLFDIYIFTGITLLTILITLTRSFLFFNVGGNCGWVAMDISLMQ